MADEGGNGIKMKTVTIITPANIEVEYKLAGVGARLTALIVDTFVQIMAVLLCAGIIFGTNHRIRQAGANTNMSTVFAIFIVVVFVIYFGYYLVLEMAMNGQTLGKRLFGLRIIRDNGQPIEFSQVLIRGLIRPVVDMMYVGLFVILFSKKHKRIGDMAAGTIVVVETYDDDIILGISNWELPHGFPPLTDMTAEERGIVEAWLRRRDSFADSGAELEYRLARYFSMKERADCINSGKGIQ